MARKSKKVQEEADDDASGLEKIIVENPDEEETKRYKVLDDNALPGTERDDEGCIEVTPSRATHIRSRGVALQEVD